MLLLELLLGLIRFLLGAALFSFMNVVAWRLPRDMDPLKGRRRMPAVRPHAGCAGLSACVQLVILAAGGAATAVRTFRRQYLLVELLGGVLALGCTWRYGAAYALPGGLFGMSWAALLALAVCGILLSVSLIDAETQTIPDPAESGAGGLRRGERAALPCRLAAARHRCALRQCADVSALPCHRRRVRRRRPSS